jgi:hypothetical protein
MPVVNPIRLLCRAMRPRLITELIDQHCGYDQVADLETSALKAGWHEPIYTVDQIKEENSISILAYWYCSFAEVLSEFRKVSPPKLIFVDTMNFHPLQAMLTAEGKEYIIVSKGSIGRLISNVKRLVKSISDSKYYKFNFYPGAYISQDDKICYEEFSNELQFGRSKKLTWIPYLWITFLQVIMHETAHHLNGHLKFKNQYFKQISSLTENEKGILNRTLEFDADAFLASESINYILGKYKIPPLFDRIGEQGRSLEIIMLQTATVMLCQSPNLLKPIHELQSIRSHDLDRWRARHILETMIRFFEFRGNRDEAEMARKNHMAAFDVMHLSSHDITIPRFVPSAKEEEAYQDNLSNLLGCWSAIRPLVMQFKQGIGKAAPAQRPPDQRFIFS